MNKVSEPAIVLNTCEVQEADLIVTFLGKNLGKNTAFAKNARLSKKRFSGGIDIFDCGVFELNENRRHGGMFSLQAISRKEVWPELRKSLTKLSLASFCLEITNCFTIEGDHDASSLFPPLFLSLRSLSNSPTDNESYAIVNYFALLTLKNCGYNLLDAAFALSPVLHSWFEQMIDHRSPIVPPDDFLSLRGFERIAQYIENTLGYPLNNTTSHWRGK